MGRLVKQSVKRSTKKRVNLSKEEAGTPFQAVVIKKYPFISRKLSIWFNGYFVLHFLFKIIWIIHICLKLFLDPLFPLDAHFFRVFSHTTTSDPLDRQVILIIHESACVPETLPSWIPRWCVKAINGICFVAWGCSPKRWFTENLCSSCSWDSSFFQKLAVYISSTFSGSWALGP